MTDDMIRRVIEATRPAIYGEKRQWVDKHSGLLKDVNLESLLASMDKTFDSYAQEHGALVALALLARRERPDAVPVFLFRMAELVKPICVQGELPVLVQPILGFVDDLSAPMQHALLLDLFLFVAEVDATRGLWWYSLAARDLAKRLLCVPLPKSRLCSDSTLRLCRRACNTMSWDIPFWDLVIFLGYLNSDQWYLYDALRGLLPTLVGGHEALARAERNLEYYQTPMVDVPEKMRQADGEEHTRAALALRAVAQLALAADAEIASVGEDLAVPVLRALSTKGGVNLERMWQSMSREVKGQLVFALESADPEGVAHAMNFTEPSAEIIRIAKAGYGGPSPIPLPIRKG